MPLPATLAGVNIEEIKKLTPYQDINNVLAEWTEDVKGYCQLNLTKR